MKPNHLISLLLILVFSCDSFAGIPSKKSEYIGGTVASVPKSAMGVIDTDDTKQLRFDYEKGKLVVPYEQITSLAYGQHAGRRVGATVAWGVTTLGIGALPILFSKKRRHYLTIEFKDDTGTAQAAIFEVGKDAIRTTLKSLEVRTGKKVEYEDEEARKSGNK